MLTQKPTQELLNEWKNTWAVYKNRLRPNRKSGADLLRYLQSKYVLTELHDCRSRKVVSDCVTRNRPFAEKIPCGMKPAPKAFFLENVGNGRQLYQPDNRDPDDLWGGPVSRIFVGIDLTTGYYTVEGCTMLWDELCAFQGLDEKDLQNYFCVAQYINSLKRFGLLEAVLSE